MSDRDKTQAEAINLSGEWVKTLVEEAYIEGYYRGLGNDRAEWEDSKAFKAVERIK